MKNETIDRQWDAILLMRRKIETRNKMIERRDIIIQKQNEDLESMSVRLAAADAVLKTEKQKATYAGTLGYRAFSSAQSVFKKARMLLGYRDPELRA